LIGLPIFFDHKAKREIRDLSRKAFLAQGLRRGSSSGERRVGGASEIPVVPPAALASIYIQLAAGNASFAYRHRLRLRAEGRANPDGALPSGA
jgi:hypothetical protein